MKPTTNNHRHRIKIVTETTFGHGDSTTEMYAICTDCGKKTDVVCKRGFPATYEDIRAVQLMLNES